MAFYGGELVDAFAAVGWQWGGRWSDPDYQHFSVDRRLTRRDRADTVTGFRNRGGAMVALVEPRRPFIDGKYVPGDGPTLAVENPATEETIAEVETASTEQIEQAIGAARRTLRRRRVERARPRRERAAVVRRDGRVPRRAPRPARRHGDRGSGRAVRERDDDPGRRRARSRATDPRPLPRARAAGVQPDPADRAHARRAASR